MLSLLKKYLPFLIPFLKYIHKNIFQLKNKIFKSDSRILNNSFRPQLRRIVTRMMGNKYSADSNVDEVALKCMRENGFASIEDAFDMDTIESVRKGMLRLYQKPEIIKHHLGTDIIDATVDFEKEFPELFRLFNKKVSSFIESYYGSKFNLYYISCAIKKHNEVSKNIYEMESMLWHFDDFSKDMMHLIVFLHDTEPKHGATQLLPKKRSEYYLRNGYYNRYYLGDLEEQIENDPQKITLNSKVGSAHFVFSPLCMHKAGIPQDGVTRESIILTMRPGLRPRELANLSFFKHSFYKIIFHLTEDWKNKGLPNTRKIDLDQVN